MSDTQVIPSRVPRAVIKALRLYALQNDTTVQAVGVEAIKLWAAEKGIALPFTPPETQENTGDVALTSNETHPGMSSAIRV